MSADGSGFVLWLTAERNILHPGQVAKLKRFLVNAPRVVLLLARRLIRKGGGSASRTASLAIFAFACVFQLFASGIYHFLMPGTLAHLILLQIDHAAIFFLIAWFLSRTRNGKTV